MGKLVGKVHHCGYFLPGAEESTSLINGAIWQCDCGQKYKLVTYNTPGAYDWQKYDGPVTKVSKRRLHIRIKGEV